MKVVLKLGVLVSEMLVWNDSFAPFRDTGTKTEPGLSVSEILCGMGLRVKLSVQVSERKDLVVSCLGFRVWGLGFRA